MDKKFKQSLFLLIGNCITRLVFFWSIKATIFLSRLMYTFGVHKDNIIPIDEYIQDSIKSVKINKSIKNNKSHNSENMDKDST